MPPAYVPTLSDFPPGTQFMIKEFDIPLAKIPLDGKAEWVNWFGGVPSACDVTRLRVDNNWPAQSFDEWAGIVAASIPAGAQTFKTR